MHCSDNQIFLVQKIKVPKPRRYWLVSKATDNGNNQEMGLDVSINPDAIYNFHLMPALPAQWRKSLEKLSQNQAEIRKQSYSQPYQHSATGD